MAKKDKTDTGVETAPEVEGSESKTVNKHDRLDKLLQSKTMEAIIKSHGSILSRGSEHHSSTHHYLSSGSFSLDWCLGGGFRVGGIHTLWGQKSSGKTTTLLSTLGDAQKRCSRCWTYATFHDEDGVVLKTPKCECGKYRSTAVLFMNVEGSWDASWARNMGLTLEDMLLLEPENAEQALDIAEGLLLEGNVDILAIDSLAAMTPSKEIEEKTSKDLMGAQPRVLGKGIRKFVSALNHMGNKNGRKPTIFFTNQIRNKLGVMFGSPEVAPGGLAPQFAATTEVKFKNPKYEIEKSKDTEPEQDVDLNIVKPLSALFSFRVEKNKQGSPMAEGSYRVTTVNSELRHKGEVQDENVILDWAEKYEIVKKENSKWTCAGVPFDTRKSIEESLIKDKAFKHILAKQVLDILLKD